MKLGYTIVFVKDVAETIAFYEKAFRLQRGFVTESFGTMKTGETTLAFGWIENERRELGRVTFRENSLDHEPAGAQISFVSDDVESDFKHAVDAGARPVVTPKRQPWGQVVSRVRDNNGFLVSIVSPPPQP